MAQSLPLGRFRGGRAPQKFAQSKNTTGKGVIRGEALRLGQEEEEEEEAESNMGPVSGIEMTRIEKTVVHLFVFLFLLRLPGV